MYETISHHILLQLTTISQNMLKIKVILYKPRCSYQYLKSDIISNMIVISYLVVNTTIIIYCMYETIFISIAAYYYKPEHVKDQGNKQKCSYFYLKRNNYYK